MDETVAPERDEVGLGIAPARERLRPLPRATEIEYRLAQRDHLAVGDPGEHRGHLVCRDGDHDLVEQRHAVGDSALQDQRSIRARVARTSSRRRRRSARRSRPLRRSSDRRLRRFPRTGAASAVSIRSQACSTQSRRRPSSSRPPRPTQPIAGARSPRKNSPSACQNAQRAARSASPRRSHAWCARIQASSHSTSRPTMYAATARRSRSSALQLPLAISRRQLGERVTPLPTLERAAGSLLSIGHGHRGHDTRSRPPGGVQRLGGANPGSTASTRRSASPSSSGVPLRSSRR